MLTITPAATIPEIIREKFTTEPAANNHGYTSAFYAIDTKNKYKYLIEILTGPRPLYVITAADQYTKYIICFEQPSPRTINITHAEVYKNGSNYPERREESPRLLKKYSFIACLLYGLIKNGEAPAGAAEEQPAEIITTGKPYHVILYRVNAAARFMILDKNNNIWIDGPAAELEAHKNEIRKTEPAADFTDENGARYVFRTYTAWTVDAAILREYTITAKTDEAAEETARALAAGQPYSVNRAYSTAEEPAPAKAADERPKRLQAWRVECRSPRGSWTTYSEEQPTREAAAHIMEEAENRNTRTTDGAPIFYRIAQIDKGPATPDPLPEESTPESSTPGENTPGADKAPEEATSETTKYYYIVENENGETVAAGEVVAANIRKALKTVATEAAAATRNYINDTGLKARFSYGGSNTPIAEEARQYMNTQRAQEATKSAGTAAEDETHTNGETAQQRTTSGPETAPNRRDTAPATAEKAPGRPETSNSTQGTKGNETSPQRATDSPTEAAQARSHSSTHKQRQTDHGPPGRAPAHGQSATETIDRAKNNTIPISITIKSVGMWIVCG